jgi:hypothetical protein
MGDRYDWERSERLGGTAALGRRRGEGAPLYNPPEIFPNSFQIHHKHFLNIHRRDYFMSRQKVGESSIKKNIYLYYMRTLVRLTEARDTFSYTTAEVTQRLSLLLNEAYKALAVRHMGGKKEVPHYHIVIDHPQTFDVRTWFKDTFNKGQGNKHHSIKEADDSDNSLSYLFHENIDEECITYNLNYTQDDIDRFIDLNRVVQSAMVTPLEVCKKLAEEILKENLPRNYKNIIRLIYHHFKSTGSWIPDRRQTERYLHKIIALTSEDSFEHWYKYYWEK